MDKYYSLDRFCVYVHRRMDTNEIFYVGIGTIDRPYHTHKRNESWHRVVKEAGGNYTVEIICENMSSDFVKQVEIGLIASIGRLDLGTGTLCNRSNGGDGASTNSDRHRIARAKRLMNQEVV